jgi:glyoxylase-like metal-dependent hydrolase (beta-lactamase superfamily II)
VNKEQNICIGGDVLFDGSIGRTDLPGGDSKTLIESIHNKIFPLGKDMVVYPGHGPTTTVGKEMKSNPFCAIR